MDEIKTSEFQQLQREIAAVRAEVKAGHDAMMDFMPKLRKTVEEMLKAELHTIALNLEREFGACVSFTAGSGARQKLDDDQVKASLASFRTQLSRQADHLTNLQGKVQKLERNY